MWWQATSPTTPPSSGSDTCELTQDFQSETFSLKKVRQSKSDRRSTMRILALRILAIILLSAMHAAAFTQTVTLRPPRDPVTKKYDEGKACFSFKSGLLKEVTKKDWELGYGFLRISEQDWFTVNTSRESRSVIKDLGELKWEDSFTVPPL